MYDIGVIGFSWGDGVGAGIGSSFSIKMASACSTNIFKTPGFILILGHSTNNKLESGIFVVLLCPAAFFNNSTIVKRRSRFSRGRDPIRV
jgi:hypothetical protein